MKIQEVIDRILAFHPSLGEKEHNTLDGIKIGNPDQECTGIAAAIYASADVIRQAHAAGANLLVVHEPVFYDNNDFSDLREMNEAARKKKELCEACGMVIFRDHDHMHAHRPDGIYYGVLTELGLQSYVRTDLFAPKGTEKFNFLFELPGIPVKELAALWADRLGLKNIRLVGNPETIVRKMAWGIHCGYGSQEEIRKIESEGIDLYVPGECLDWEIPEYFKDAGALGLNKALMLIGHFNKEELGMKHAVTWIARLVDYRVPVTWCPNHDMYWYLQDR